MSDDKPDFNGEGNPGQYLNWNPRFGTGMWDGTFSPMGPDGQTNQDLRFSAPPDIDKYFGQGAHYEKVADIPPPLPGNPGASVWAPVFKDGTRIPDAGNVFDTGKGKYQANSDGTYAPWTPAGTGETIRPTSYTLSDGRYTPIDKTGNAIGRPQTTIPNRDQWMADPHDATRLIPDPSKTPPPAGAAGGAGDADGLSTDEENSGRAADAIRQAKEGFAKKKTSLHEAEEQLTEIMLSARAADEDGRKAVQGIQKDVIAGLEDYLKHPDDPTYELQFLKFLRDKAAQAGDLLENNKIAAADKARMAMALSDFYKEGGNVNSSGPGGQEQPPGGQSMTDPRLTNPGSPGLLTPDAPPPDLGPAPVMPDPTAADVLGGGLGPGSPLGDALSSAGPLLQGLPNTLGAGGGGAPGLDLGAITKPISDAISGAAGGDHGRGDHDGEGRDDGPGRDGRDGKDEHDKPGRDKPDEPGNPNPKPQDPNNPASPPATPAPGTAPEVTPPAPPTVPSTTVDLKDGASVTAADTNRAGALRDALKGTPAGEAYRLNNLSVPPPGTSLSQYVRPNDLQPGDYAMYKDRIEMIVDPSKWIGSGGQIQPMSTLPQGEGFEGFGRPTQAAATPATPPGVVSPPAQAATPPAATGLGQSVVPPSNPRK